MVTVSCQGSSLVDGSIGVGHRPGMATGRLRGFERTAATIRRLRTSTFLEEVADSLTAQAYSARKIERANASEVLDRPRAFTLSSFYADRATADDLRSVIRVGPRMEEILHRLEYGGEEDEGLSIVDKSFENRYGDLGPKGVLRILKKDRRSRTLSAAAVARRTLARQKRVAKTIKRAENGTKARNRLRQKALPKTMRIGAFAKRSGQKVVNTRDRYFLATIKNTTGIFKRDAGKRGKGYGSGIELIVAFNRNPKWNPQLGFIKEAKEAGERYPERAAKSFGRALSKARRG